MHKSVIGSLILGVSLLPATLLAADAFVSTQVDSSKISWASQVRLDNGYGLQLTISGPNDWYFRRQFAAGSPAVFSPTDNPAGKAADGSYTYELVAVQTDPSSYLKRPQGGAGSDTRTLVASGAFRVQDGAIASKDDIEGNVTRDQQILDDLIVDGSLCVGLDCVNGESFGFDTIRLKENNLRIKFQDTSNSASFPTNDWQITANDSTNGGANKFSIDDIDGGRTPFTIEAGAPSNSLYVEDSGQIGLGTSNPVVEVHVVDGDTPTLRLEQDGSSGFTPQTWDLAGNETNFFIRDVTNGSRLPFRIRPGAPTSSIDVAADGKVGLGTGSPQASLDIKGSGPGVRLTNTGTSNNAWEFFVNEANGRYNLKDVTTGTTPMKVELGSNANLLRLGVDGTGAASPNTVSIGHDSPTLNAILDVRGSINVDGTQVHADYVFEPDYNLHSIEDHSKFMWQNKHLPSMPKAPESLRGPVNLVEHQMKLLEELEVAHIYIEQLNSEITELKTRTEQLEGNVTKN